MTNRIIFGFHDNALKARISNPGYDVLTTTDLSKLQMHEDYGGAFILLSGSVYMPKGSAQQVLTFPDQGVVPIFRCHTAITTSWFGTSYPVPMDAWGGSGLQLTSSTITFPANPSDSYSDYTYFYVVYASTRI